MWWVVVVRGGVWVNERMWAELLFCLLWAHIALLGRPPVMTWRVNVVDLMVAQRLAGDVSLLSGL